MKHLMAALSLAFLAGSMFAQEPAEPERPGLRLSIDGPKSLNVGSQSSYKITLTNDGQFTARKVFVLVGFPKGASIQLPPDSGPNVVEMKRLILEFDRPFMDLTVTELKPDQKVVFDVLVRASEKGGHRLGCMTCARGFAATDAGIEIAFVDAPKDKAEPKKKPDPAFEKAVDDPKLPRVLIIGDSISIGYTPGTRKLLAGKANVHRIPENAADTKTGVAKLSKWLGDSKWDVIHFNWGLHDLKLGAGSHQVSPADYDKNLREIVTRLKATKAKLIWASTTAVPDAKLNPPRSNDDVIAYNLAASRIMKEHGIAINDLYGFVQPRLKELQQNANVHFKPAGSSALAEQVAAAIRSALEIK